MLSKTAILAATFFSHAEPTATLGEYSHLTSTPRAIAAFKVQQRAIEISAVTQRRRADTVLRRAYMEETQAMGKVLPGYPQPAFVSFDIRVKF